MLGERNAAVNAIMGISEGTTSDLEDLVSRGHPEARRVHRTIKAAQKGYGRSSDLAGTIMLPALPNLLHWQEIDGHKAAHLPGDIRAVFEGIEDVGKALSARSLPLLRGFAATNWCIFAGETSTWSARRFM